VYIIETGRFVGPSYIIVRFNQLPRILALVVICLLISIPLWGCSSSEDEGDSATPTSNEISNGVENTDNIDEAGPIYMSLVSSTLGPVEGSCTTPGHEGNISIYSFSHELSASIGSQTGQPSGKKVHAPLTITKPIDKTSPHLYWGFDSGENFDSLTIELYRFDKTGREEHYFTIKLEDAMVLSIQPYTPLRIEGVDRPANDYAHMETVSFTYKKITWIHIPDGVSYEADWPVSSG